MYEPVVKEYNKIKESYRSYLENYKAFNKGSLRGAASFNSFYLSKTYTSKYNDNRKSHRQ